MGRCPHNDVQQYTEICMQCGRNIYETDEECYAYLLQQKQQVNRNDLSNKIQKLERELGINHPGNNSNHYPGNTSDGSNIVNGEWNGNPPDCGMW